MGGAVGIIWKIYVFILLSPLMGVFLWGILDPESYVLFGNKWRFKGDLEPSEEAINLARKSSIAGLIITIIFYIIYVISG